MEKQKIRKLSTIAMLSALAFMATVVGRFPILPTFSFLKYDPKDVIIVICGFIFGPLSAVISTVIVATIEMMTVSSTGWIGWIMNVLSTVAFAGIASYIYARNKTLKSAIIGLLSGIIAMASIMLLWNYIMTPLFTPIPRGELVKLLLPAILPFNLLKGGINAALVILIYKPLSKSLRTYNLAPDISRTDYKGGISTLKLLYAIAIFALLTFVLIILAQQGII